MWQPTNRFLKTRRWEAVWRSDIDAMQKTCTGKMHGFAPNICNRIPPEVPENVLSRFCFERCPMVFTMVSACFYYGVFKLCLSFCSEISAHLGWNWKNWMNWKNWKNWKVFCMCERYWDVKYLWWRWCSMLMVLMLLRASMLSWGRRLSSGARPLRWLNLERPSAQGDFGRRMKLSIQISHILSPMFTYQHGQTVKIC